MIRILAADESESDTIRPASLDTKRVCHKETEVTELTFEISVQNFVAVNVVEAFQQLLHELLDLRQAELYVHVAHQAGQIVIAELEHQVERRSVRVLFRSADLQQTDHVLVLQLLQNPDLTQCGDRKALRLVRHQHLLQRHDLSGFLVPSLEHLAKCTCALGGQRERRRWGD